MRAKPSGPEARAGIAIGLLLLPWAITGCTESGYVTRMRQYDASWPADRVSYEAELQQFRRGTQDDNAAHQGR